MITYVIGDIFESPAHVLVNTVNTEGVMGKGIAKEFKRIYPAMFKEYQKICESGKFTVGKLWLYKTKNKWILNFPTKTTWRKPSKIEYIEEGLREFVRTYAELGITSIAFPPLGCGNGELDWETQVKPLMEKYLILPIDVFIYPKGIKPFIPEHKDKHQIEKWLREEPHSLSFEEVWRDLEKIIDGALNIKNDDSYSYISISKVLDNEKGIIINSTLIMERDIREFWCLLRDYGFIMVNNVPSSLAKHFETLVTLFSFLPYCKIVNVSSDYDALKNTNIQGLQLVLYAGKSDSLQQTLPLFDK